MFHSNRTLPIPPASAPPRCYLHGLEGHGEGLPGERRDPGGRRGQAQVLPHAGHGLEDVQQPVGKELLRQGLAHQLVAVIALSRAGGRTVPSAPAPAIFPAITRVREGAGTWPRRPPVASQLPNSSGRPPSSPRQMLLLLLRRGNATS